MDKLLMTPRKKIDFWKFTDKNKIEAVSHTGTYEFDEISAFVWERCDGFHTVAQIIDELAEACNMLAEKSTVKKDITGLLDDWKRDQLIILNYHPLHAFSEYDEDRMDDISSIDSTVDFLLIVPPTPNPATEILKGVQKIFPLGIGYLSANLKKHGYSVEMANLWLRNTNQKSIKELIRRANPRLIGISTMTENFQNGVRIAEVAKEVNPDIITVFGGPHVTFTDTESLQNQPVIDIIVRNEGESTIVELANYFIHRKGDLQTIKGITYRSNGQIQRNPSRQLIKNLDDLPFPDRVIEEDDKVKIGIQTSRGCPGACIFCVASSMSGGRYRLRSPENVVQELSGLYEKGHKDFFFYDDTFTGDIARLKQIFELMKEKKIDIKWSAESRVDVVDQDPHIFKLMAEHGCEGLQFGVESGSQITLDNLNKNTSVDQIFKAIKASQEAGIQVVCTMLMGHPYDTHESIKQTIAFAKGLTESGSLVFFSVVCPYPGTQIRLRADYYKLKIRDVSYSEYFVINAFMDIENLRAEEIRGLYYDGMREVILSSDKYKIMMDHIFG
jgi:radical SAM superfamily enzyme YgiQ (UPF0313 family)